jgi:uncharacterized membrane protein YadS
MQLLNMTYCGMSIATLRSSPVLRHERCVLRQSNKIKFMRKLIPVFILIALGIAAQTSFASTAPPPGGTAPDSASTALMLTAAMGGLSWVCKRVRR